jgi:hypothetical protein
LFTLNLTKGRRFYGCNGQLKEPTRRPAKVGSAFLCLLCALGGGIYALHALTPHL